MEIAIAMVQSVQRRRLQTDVLRFGRGRHRETGTEQQTAVVVVHHSVSVLLLRGVVFRIKTVAACGTHAAESGYRRGPVRVYNRMEGKKKQKNK